MKVTSGSAHVSKQCIFPILGIEQALDILSVAWLLLFPNGWIKTIAQGTISSNNRIYVHTTCAYCLIGKVDNQLEQIFILNIVGRRLAAQIALLEHNKNTQVASVLA